MDDDEIRGDELGGEFDADSLPKNKKPLGDGDDDGDPDIREEYVDKEDEEDREERDDEEEE